LWFKAGLLPLFPDAVQRDSDVPLIRDRQKLCV
jgi:hypothetical protein